MILELLEKLNNYVVYEPTLKRFNIQQQLPRKTVKISSNVSLHIYMINDYNEGLAVLSQKRLINGKIYAYFYPLYRGRILENRADLEKFVKLCLSMVDDFKLATLSRNAKNNLKENALVSLYRKYIYGFLQGSL